MPVNFQEIQNQIKEMGKQAPEREKLLKEKAERAWALLQMHANRLDELRRLVGAATTYYSGLRCAVPLDEPLTLHRPLPATPAPQALIAADGSQINPDRHAQVQFGVINVGAIRMTPGQAPREIIQSRLLYHDELETKDGPVGEEVVALMRDLAERQALAELASQEHLGAMASQANTAALLTLTDGPLELFREPKDRGQFQQLFEEYLGALAQLAELGVITAGYVDRPRGDLVVRLLELTELRGPELEKAGQTRPLRPVMDLALFARLLKPGERSALFEIQSSQARKFTGVTALHFFYLNVGRPGHPYLARVELPQWVACDPAAVDLLHVALVAQCRQMGARPYPYALHRAHEVAVVSFDEKRQLEEMIALELRRQGLGIEGTSFKQANKDNLGGKTRYS